MDIRINGLSMDDYLHTPEYINALYIATESFDLQSNAINVYQDTDDINVELVIETFGLESLNYFGLEASLAGDIAKGTFKGLAAGARGIKSGYTNAKKGATNLKINWSKTYKPLLVKLLQTLVDNMSGLWNALMKYDQQYKELGKDISNVIDFYGKNMGKFSTGSVTLQYHMFDPQLLLGYMNVIHDYSAFMNAVKNHKEIFGGDKFLEPTDVINLLKQDDTTELREFITKFNEGITKLNQMGDLSLAYAIYDSKDFFKFFRSFDRKLIKKAYDQKVSLSDFVKVTILRNNRVKEYDTSNIAEFKLDMLSTGGFLTALKSILNNNVLENMLKGSGDSIKKQMKKDIQEVDRLVTSAISEQNAQDAKNKTANQNQETAAKNAENNMKTEVDNIDKNNDSTTGTEAESNTEKFAEQAYGTQADVKSESNAKAKEDAKNSDNKSSNDGTVDPNSKSSLANVYVKLYGQMITKCVTTYSGMAKGVLSSTHTLIKEGSTIVGLIKTSTVESTE